MCAYNSTLLGQTVSRQIKDQSSTCTVHIPECSLFKRFSCPEAISNFCKPCSHVISTYNFIHESSLSPKAYVIQKCKIFISSHFITQDREGRNFPCGSTVRYISAIFCFIFAHYLQCCLYAVYCYIFGYGFEGFHFPFD